MSAPATRPAPTHVGPAQTSLALESLAIALVFTALAFWLNANQSLSWADEGLLWYGSQQVHAGNVPVRDFYSYDPGRYYWTAAVYRLVGDQSLRTTLLAATAFSCVALTTLLVALGKSGLARPWRIVLTLAITVAFAYPRHKVFDQSLSLLLASAILLVLAKPRSSRLWLLFGILTGLAACMGRNHGVFFVAGAALTGCYLLWTGASVRLGAAVFAYALGTSIGYLPVMLLCLVEPGFATAFWESILLTSQWQLKLPIPFPWRVNTEGLPPLRAVHLTVFSWMCLAVPASYLVTLAWTAIRARRGASTPLMRSMAAMSLAGVPYLHQAFDRADFDHFVQGVIPAFALFVCLAAAPAPGRWIQVVGRGCGIVALSLLMLLWLPYAPHVRMSLMERQTPESTAQFDMDGTSYRIERYQANLLTTVRSMARRCQVSDRQFLAAPHFPGLYAFLGIQAPGWESYYLHNRPQSMQEQHLHAMGEVRLAVVATESTIDQLDRLLFRNMHRTSQELLDSEFEKSSLQPFPYPLAIYTRPKSCPTTPSTP
jgi:hypothetical protein